MLFYLKDVSSKGMSGHDNIGWSLLLNATVMLINTRTNVSHPHWVEFDFVDPTSPSVIVQPAEPMEFGTRYVVGIRNLVSNATGEVIAASPAMQILLGQSAPGNESLVRKDRWEYYQTQVFPWLIDAKNFTRAEIQLAWDFTTVSRETLLERAESMRDNALEHFENGTVSYKINSIVESECSSNPNTTIGRTIYGSVQTPLYLTSQQRLAKLPRTSKEHRVEIMTPLGTHASNFIIRIPCSLTSANGTKKAKALIQYGHGLFGSRAEVRAGWIATFANQNDYIFLASDWFGMAKYVSSCPILLPTLVL
jgi:hypothetical protein